MSSLTNHGPDVRRWPHPAGGREATPRPSTVLVVVDDVTDVLDGPVDYALALHPQACLAVHVRESRREAASISRAWAAFHPAIPLGVVDRGLGSRVAALRPIVDRQWPTPEHPLVVVVPNHTADRPVGPGELVVGDGAVEVMAAFAERDDVVVVSVSSTGVSARRDAGRRR